MGAVGAMTLLASQAPAGTTEPGVTTPPVNFEIPASAVRSWIGMYVSVATLAAVVLAVVYATHAVPATRARLLPRALSVRWARRLEAGEVAGPRSVLRLDPAHVHGLRQRQRAVAAALARWLARRRPEPLRPRIDLDTLFDRLVDLPAQVRLLPWVLRLRWARRLADGEFEREHFLRGLQRVDLERLQQQQRAAAAALKKRLTHGREPDVLRHVDVVEPYDRELSGHVDSGLLGSFHHG